MARVTLRTIVGLGLVVAASIGRADDTVTDKGQGIAPRNAASQVIVPQSTQARVVDIPAATAQTRSGAIEIWRGPSPTPAPSEAGSQDSRGIPLPARGAIPAAPLAQDYQPASPAYNEYLPRFVYPQAGFNRSYLPRQLNLPQIYPLESMSNPFYQPASAYQAPESYIP